jgi:hypothetical protein
VVGVTPDRVSTQGIEGLTLEDIAHARRTGHVVKLLAEIDTRQPGLGLRVGPALVPVGHPLARVHGAENAVHVSAELAGELLLQGQGAGPRPTASAIFGDLARCLPVQRREHGTPRRSAATTHSTAHNPIPRRHALRFGRSAGPEVVLSTLRQHGLAADDVELSRGAARVLVARASHERVAALAAALGPDALIMPVCDDQRAVVASC